jgi:hypothetical protein
LHLQVYRKSATPGSAMTLQNAPITLDTGNYSLSELEEAIAKKLYELVNFAEHRNACDELHTAVTLNFANKHGPGSSGGVAVNTKVNVSDVQVQPVTVTPDPTTGVQFKDALTITECQHLLTGNTYPIHASDSALGSTPNVLPPLSKGYLQGTDLTGVTKFGFKPVTLEADFENNRVRIQLGMGVSMTEVQQKASTLFTKVLGRTVTEPIGTFVDHDGDGEDAGHTPDVVPQIFKLFATSTQEAARIDKTRAVAFHCPSLASGTYGTSGSHGDSQLAVVPITVGIGSVQSWETFEPIRIPSHVAGGPVSVLSFYISNEEGETINTMGERFEAVMVVEYDVPVK